MNVNVPQSADEAIGGTFCVHGADVPDVQKTGHLIGHVSHTGVHLEERGHINVSTQKEKKSTCFK